MTPPVAEISDWLKSLESSERVKVTFAVSPAIREESLEVTAMVGLTVSTERLTELLLSEPSLLVLPAESENLPVATEMTPLVVLSAVGVNVAE